MIIRNSLKLLLELSHIEKEISYFIKDLEHSRPDIDPETLLEEGI